jgi:hypothetical protein
MITLFPIKTGPPRRESTRWFEGVAINATHVRNVTVYNPNDPGGHVFNKFYGYPDKQKPRAMSSVQIVSEPLYRVREVSSYQTFVNVPAQGRMPPDVLMTFEADWIEHRSYGTCWLKLPALAGIANGAAPISRAAPTLSHGTIHVPRLTLNPLSPIGTEGSTEITGPENVLDGSLDLSASSPPSTNPSGREWSCDAPERLGFEIKYSRGCEATAVFVEQGSTTRLRVQLVLWPVLLGSGIALLLQLLVASSPRRKSRSSARSDADLPDVATQLQRGDESCDGGSPTYASLARRTKVSKIGLLAAVILVARWLVKLKRRRGAESVN